MEPISLSLMAAGLGLNAYSAFKKPNTPSMPHIPTSNLPGVLESMGVYNQLKQQGMDILKPVAPTEEQNVLAPKLDYMLAQIRDAKRRTQASMQSQGERMGLPISDITLGNLGSAETGAAMQEQGAYSDILSQALAMQSALRQQRLGYNQGLLSDAQAMALARDQADMNRGMNMAGMQSSYDAANYLAKQQQLGNMANLGGQLAGIGMYGAKNGGFGVGWPSFGGGGGGTPQQMNFLDTGIGQNPLDKYGQAGGNPDLMALMGFR